jgi:HlyD family secretion protein
MTANIQIVTAKRQDVLKVLNSALRFRPAGEEVRPQGPSGDGRAPTPAAAEPSPAEERLQQSTAALGLSEFQQNQTRAILADVRERIGVLRRQGTSPENTRSETNALRERSRSAIVALLSPEQREIFTHLSPTHAANPTTRGRVYVADEYGRPTAVDIVLGLSDGTFTEVVSGNLKDGQPVVIGTSPAGQKPSARPPTRFGFL